MILGDASVREGGVGSWKGGEGGVLQDNLVSSIELVK